MASSSDELFKRFLAAMNNPDDERLFRIHSLIERDRFGVEQLDGEIQIQLECGNYGEYGKSIWQSFKKEHARNSSEA